MILGYNKPVKCFSPLAGIRFVVRQQERGVPASTMRRFSPLAGIRFVARVLCKR